MSEAYNDALANQPVVIDNGSGTRRSSSDVRIAVLTHQRYAQAC